MQPLPGKSLMCTVWTRSTKCEQPMPRSRAIFSSLFRCLAETCGHRCILNILHHVSPKGSDGGNKSKSEVAALRMDSGPPIGVVSSKGAAKRPGRLSGPGVRMAKTAGRPGKPKAAAAGAARRKTQTTMRGGGPSVGVLRGNGGEMILRFGASC